jgi:hypothetical protein
MRRFDGFFTASEYAAGGHAQNRHTEKFKDGLNAVLMVMSEQKEWQGRDDPQPDTSR